MLRVRKANIRALFIIAAIGLGMYVFLPQLSAFRTAVEAIRDANSALLALGAMLAMGTWFGAAFSYKSLAIKPLKYRRTLLIEAGSSFTNRLLPAGAGNLALNVRYLIKAGHSKTQAASVAVTNNLIGILEHLSLLVVTLLWSHERATTLPRLHISGLLWIVGVGIIASAVAAYAYFPGIRHKTHEAIKDVLRSLKVYHQHPLRLLGGWIGSMIITLLNAAALYVSALALGVHLTLVQVIFVFTIGVVSAAITPTPGGIGGAEAGLAAALKAVGVESGLALSVALAYRFLTYWLPIFPGYICFHVSVKRKYI